MTAPFPIHVINQTAELTQIAENIFRDYTWIARWSDEIGTDAHVDLKKLALLALKHAVSFAQATDNPPAGIVAAVEKRFEAEGLTWPTRNDMTTDLTAIRDECILLTAYVDTNVPEALEYEMRTLVKAGSVWNFVDVPQTMAKPHAVVAEVAKVRALYD